MGIYIHIPFCKQKCHYCDFHFSTSLKNKEDLISCLLKEIEIQKSYLNEEIVDTIYFGGGTPSFLDAEEIRRILDKVYAEFSIISNPEITLEGNPDDFTLQKLQELKQAGINRLSIGIQSFNDVDLTWMNRAHNSNQATKCVQDAQSLGFDNITIDLIYGLPEMTIESWKINLQKALDLHVQHISAYNLTVEPGTALHHFVKTGKSQPLNDEAGAEQFELLINTLENNNFKHYEISSFGKEGYFSKHNSSYWKRKFYLGIGPSAHSFNGNTRQWNVANNAKYIKGINAGEVPFELEKLSKNDRYNEYILLGLRTIWGCEFDYIKSEFGEASLLSLKQQLFNYSDQINMDEQSFSLNQKGKAFADRIASELFV
jgi:oxygen-independent coproporphyrinogen III oxidase